MRCRFALANADSVLGKGHGPSRRRTVERSSQSPPISSRHTGSARRHARRSSVEAAVSMPALSWRMETRYCRLPMHGGSASRRSRIEMAYRSLTMASLHLIGLRAADHGGHQRKSATGFDRLHTYPNFLPSVFMERFERSSDARIFGRASVADGSVGRHVDVRSQIGGKRANLVICDYVRS